MISRLFRKRSIYLPTWKLVVALIVIFAAVVFGVGRGLYPFLAPSERLDRPDVIVIDGWVSDQTMEAAVALAREQACEIILASGVELVSGSFLSEYKTYAHLGEASLEALGVPADQVHPAPAGPNHRHRTFASAAAVYQWLEKHDRLDARVMIITEGPHSRRSASVYHKVFSGASAEIGIISRPPLAYDPDAWWKTSSGMKSVIVECIALADEWLRDGGRSTNDPRSVPTGITAAP